MSVAVEQGSLSELDSGRKQSLTGQRSRAVSTVLVVVVLLVTGVRLDVVQNFTVGAIISVLLLPLWAPALRQFRWATAFVVVGTLVALSGLWLAGISSTDHSFDLRGQVGSIALLIDTVVGVGVVLWGRTLMPTSRVALWYGIGMVLGSPFGSRFAENPWKFGLAIGATIVILAIAVSTRRRGLELLAVAALAIVSTVTDSRSQFTLLILVGVLVLWEMRPQLGKRASTVTVLAVLAVIGVVVFNAAQALILNGALGQVAQQRSLSQIGKTGFIILGGRPELAATASLMLERPFGFGPGVIPTSQDISVAKAGMRAIGYDPDNGYVENYMFGDRIELHSLFGDLWAAFGIPGLAFALALVVAAIVVTARGLARRTVNALALFAAVELVWNVLFSPAYGGMVISVITIGLIVLRRDRDPALSERS